MTVLEAQTQYAANADYDGDATKMALALQALRVLRVNRANMSGAGSSMNWPAVDAEIDFLTKAVGSSARSSLTPCRAKYL